MYVGGEPAKEPRCGFACHVPEGQYNEERRADVIAAVTQAVVEAEDGSLPAPERRVVVFTNEIKDGTLGGAGRPLRLPDIYEFFTTCDGSREAAEQVLAARRRGEDSVVGAIDDAGAASAPVSQPRPEVSTPLEVVGT
jgi:phenylpyruvate tautomerase PptA (4-oxalocrotonate tautomerase family)